LSCRRNSLTWWIKSRKEFSFIQSHSSTNANSLTDMSQIHTWSVAAVFYCSCRWFSLEWLWGFWLWWQRCPATSVSAPYDCRVLYTVTLYIKILQQKMLKK